MVNKKILITSALSLIAALGYAQPAGLPQETAQSEDKGSLSFIDELDAQAEITNNAEKSANEYLIEKNWAEGLNEADNRYVVKAYAKISLPASDKNFQTARENAYAKAMLRAKKDIAKFYGQDIQTAMKLITKEPNSANSQMAFDAEFFSQLKDKTDAMTQKELDKKGLSRTSPEGKILVDNVLASNSFSELILTTATQRVGALVTSKIFEQDGEIVVVAYYSPNTTDLAAIINGKDLNVKVKPRTGVPVGTWAKGLKISQLYPSLGVQLTSDNDGNLVILSYGQSKARTNSGSSKSTAIEKAILNADANIRRFAGETIVYAAALESFENTVDFENEGTQSITEIEESFEEEILALSEKLRISGISTIHTWNFVDQRSDSLICGVVRMWSIKTADTANESREEMKDATKNRGGRIDSTTHSAIKKNSETSTLKTNSYDGDANKYKTQSIESEDF